MERDRLGKRANRSPTIPRHITVEDERYRRHRPALFLFVGGRRHTETATARIIGQLIGLYRNDKIKYRSIYPTYSLCGQTLFSKTIENDETIQLPANASGVYLLQLRNATQHHTCKIVL